MERLSGLRSLGLARHRSPRSEFVGPARSNGQGSLRHLRASAQNEAPFICLGASSLCGGGEASRAWAMHRQRRGPRPGPDASYEQVAGIQNRCGSESLRRSVSDAPKCLVYRA